MRARLILLVVIVSVPIAALAGSVKLKEWTSSPQAYFMTSAERQQWGALKSDAEAEQFVNTFLAARKPDFAEEVAKRAEVADKYLTVGRVPGSRTLRGKVIIIFGPPSAFDIKLREVKGAASSSANGYMAAGASTSPGGSPGPSPEEMADASRRGDLGTKQVREFTITYTGDKLPVKRAEPLTVAVDVDTSSGREWLAQSQLQSELNELFDAAANTWLLNKNH